MPNEPYLLPLVRFAKLMPGGDIGSIPYSTNAFGDIALVAPNKTSGQMFLSMTGTGTNGAAPVWATVSTGSGTVTSFSAGTLSPIFTTGVANPTTTPALSFSLSNVSSGTFLGRTAAGSGAPSYTAVTDAVLSLSDITTNDSSTSNHGFLKKLDNTATNFMNGQGNWAVPAGSGGTVTTFSAGTLSPIFTTSVANATTTPALSFSLSNAANNTFLGNTSGSTGAPSYTAVTDASLSVSDITTNNCSTSAHGFLKKLDNTATHYMGGDGNWTTPAGTTYSDFVSAGASHAHGLVIDPGATAPTTSLGDQIMMNNATWQNMGFSMWTRRFYVCEPVAGQTSNNAPTAIGGAPMANNSASGSAEDATGEYGFFTTGTTNTTIGWTAPSTVGTNFFGITSPRFVAIVKSGATSPTDKNNIRCWVGLFNSTPISTDTNITNSFGFRYSTSAGDTNWMAYNEGASSPSVVSTGVAFAVDTRYVLEAWYDNTNSHIHFYINGVQTNDISSSLPANTTAMSTYCFGRNLATETKNFKISKFIVDHL